MEDSSNIGVDLCGVIPRVTWGKQVAVAVGADKH